MIAYSTSEIAEALNTISATITNCEKLLDKFDENTSQHSLLINRIQALRSSKVQIKHNKESSTYKRLQKHINAMKIAQFYIYADLKNK